MKKSIALVFITGYWLIYLFLSGRGMFKDDDPIGVLLANVFNGMFSFFIFYFLLVPRFQRASGITGKLIAGMIRKL